VRTLAGYLTEGLPSDEEKVRAIYRWMTEHIQYDLNGLRTSDYGDLTPDGVLRSRSAVCEGYSGLFESLVKAAGFEVEVVTGFAKGLGFSAGDAVPAGFNHAWNAVKVKGEWKLLDCTWGAGALNERGEYVKGFEPFYFFTPPEQFIYSHLPSDPKWQLLPEPFSRIAFEELPQVKPAFFLCGLRFLGSPQANIRAQGPLVSVPLLIPKDTNMVATLLSGEYPAVNGGVRFLSGPEGEAVQILAPEPGTYTLRLFAAKGLSATQVDWAADLRITAERGGGGKSFAELDKKSKM
jgi:transglutaminase/protease-like cytokinesis protein 3